MQIGKWPCTSPVILNDADQSFAFDLTSRSHGWRDENTNSRLAANGQKQSLSKDGSQLLNYKIYTNQKDSFEDSTTVAKFKQPVRLY